MKKDFFNLSLLSKAHTCLGGFFLFAAILLGLNTYAKNRALVSIMQQELVVVHYLIFQIIEEFYKKFSDHTYTLKKAQSAALTALGSIDLLERGYVMVIDSSGKVLLHPTKQGYKLPHLVLQNQKLLIPDAVNKAKNNSYLIQYRGSRGEDKIGKISYFEPWGWLVIYGRYQDDIRHILLKDIIYNVIIGCVLLIVLGLILLHIRTAVVAPLGRCIKHINRIVEGGDSLVSQNEVQTLSDFTDSIVSLTMKLKQTLKNTKKVEKTLKDNQQLLFEVLNNSKVAICIKDKNLNYLRVNKAFESFVSLYTDGRDESALYKVAQSNRSGHPFLKAVKKFEAYVKLHNKPLSKEIAYSKDGIELSWLVTSFPIYDSYNDFYAVCTMATDITEYKKNEKEIAKMNTQLRKRTKELQNFIHVISHDLKSPLKNIGNCCQLLSEEYGNVLDENGALYIEHSIRNANKMVKLISELLAYSRVSMITSIKKYFPCSVAVENALVASVSLDNHDNVDVVYKNLPGIYANEVTITQVFQNLIDNSVRHSLPHAPIVKILIEAQTREKFVEFWITDNGPGIDPKYAALIFKIFQKLSIQKDDYESSGTGLAICQTIIEQHGGDIWLDTGYQSGARFKFTIPHAEPT